MDKSGTSTYPMTWKKPPYIKNGSIRRAIYFFSALYLAVAFGTMGNGLGWDFPVDPKEGQARGKKSLEILDKHLSSRKWLVGSYCTIADIACFPYVALAPMGDISLEPFRFVREWIGRFKELPNFITMPGLEI